MKTTIESIDPYIKASIYGTLAVKEAKHGLIDQAKAKVKQIDYSEARNWALRDIALGQIAIVEAERGLYEQAKMTNESIECVITKIQTYKTINELEAKNEFDRKQSSQNGTNTQKVANALQKNMVDAAKLSTTFNAAIRIKDPSKKIDALLEILRQ